MNRRDPDSNMAAIKTATERRIVSPRGCSTSSATTSTGPGNAVAHLSNSAVRCTLGAMHAGTTSAQGLVPAGWQPASPLTSARIAIESAV